jgi:hypothetical protein
MAVNRDAIAGTAKFDKKEDNFFQEIHQRIENSDKRT